MVLFGLSVINLSVKSSSTKCNWIPWVNIFRVVLVLEEQVCTIYSIRDLKKKLNTCWTCFLFSWRFCGKLQYHKISMLLSSYVVLDDFSLSQKMSCHSQRAVCLSQRPENAGSYAAPRAQQSLSLWKAAPWGFFHKYIDKNTLKSWCSLLHYKQYLVNDPNSWKLEMLRMKSWKKELASSSVWKTCHKKCPWIAKTRWKWKIDNFSRISSNWEVWDEYGVLNMEKKHRLIWLLFDNVTLSTNFA